MDLFEAIRKRHSYRGDFTDATVPREDLRRIVEAGVCAPSGRNLQSTTFVIVDDPRLVAGIAEIVDNEVVRGARAVIVCVGERIESSPGMSFEIEDCAAATESMLLAVTALGYATVWIDGALRRDDRAERIGKLVGVPEGKTIRIILPMGVPAEKREQKEKKPFEQRAWFNAYGG